MYIYICIYIVFVCVLEPCLLTGFKSARDTEIFMSKEDSYFKNHLHVAVAYCHNHIQCSYLYDFPFPYCVPKFTCVSALNYLLINAPLFAVSIALFIIPVQTKDLTPRA